VKVHLPNNWKPREPQQPVWQYLAGGGRNAVVIAHRRFGKDDIALHHAACAAHERVANYIHLLPEYEQARKAIWEAVNAHTGKRRIDEAFPADLIANRREDQMFIRFKCGSSWQVGGSDRYDSIVGAGFAGITYSEYALANPNAQDYFTPMLMENSGWQLLITTPRGKNHAHRMYNFAKKQMEAGKDWYAGMFRASETGLLNRQYLESELDRLRELHGDAFGLALWLQEYEVSFEAAIPGSIYGEDIARARAQERIGVVPIMEDIPVHTGWDLGRTDDTAIWWFQMLGNEIRLIDYEFDNFKEIPHYCRLLKEKAEEREFKYGTHFLPHDAKPVKLGMGGKSILQQFVNWNQDHGGELGSFFVMPAYHIPDQIQAVRATLKRAWIDETNCAEGLEAITQYHREWDEEKRIFTDKPVHDWSSHGSSALATVAMSWRANKVPKEDQLPTPERLVAGSVAGRTMGDMRKEFFRKAKARREGAI
jgi:phage terminase large subunit